MRTLLAILLAASLAASANAADPAVYLAVKPLLCVIDRNATGCSMSFDIRWKSATEAELCLSDSASSTPLRCWPRALSGTHAQRREVTEEFLFWLARPGSTERVAEVKVEVLRVGSDDRRRERRTRHVWDVL